MFFAATFRYRRKSPSASSIPESTGSFRETLERPSPVLTERINGVRDAFHRVHVGPVDPTLSACGAFGGTRRRTEHTVLASEPGAACVSTSCGALLASITAADSPCGSSYGVTRDALDRCLPLHVNPYEHPRLVGSRCCLRARHPRTIEEIACFTLRATRFGGPLLRPSLWHPCRLSPVNPPRSHARTMMIEAKDRRGASA